MPQQNQDDPSGGAANADNEHNDKQQQTDPNGAAAQPDAVKALVNAAVADALSGIKSKLDGAYAKLEEEKEKVKKLEDEKRARELEDLKAQGKYKEAAEREVAEANARAAAAEKLAVELSRDNELRTALAGQKFRNANALEMAFKELLPQLVKNEKNVWVHKSNVSISDAVAAFVANKDNAFLFSVKQSSGGGSGGGQPSSGDSKSTGKLFGRPIADVLADAEAGRLPHQQRRA